MLDLDCWLSRFVLLWSISQAYLDQAKEETGPKTGALFYTFNHGFCCYQLTTNMIRFFFMFFFSFLLRLHDWYLRRFFFCPFIGVFCLVSALNPDKWLEFKLQDTATVSHNTKLFRSLLHLLICCFVLAEDVLSFPVFKSHFLNDKYVKSCRLTLVFLFCILLLPWNLGSHLTPQPTWVFMLLLVSWQGMLWSH